MWPAELAALKRRHPGVMLVVDEYPTEKCWPISEWTSLGDLLEQDNLVEVFTK